MSTEDINRRIQNLIRLGTVSAVQHGDPPRVRVSTGGLNSDWLPWRETRAGNTSTWNPPTVGEQVIVFSPGGDMTGAFAVAGISTDANPAPSDSPDVTACKFPDGALMSYNHASGKLQISGIKTLEIDASDSVTIKAPTITLDAGQTVTTGAHTIEGLLSYLAGMAGSGGSDGATVITGDITHAGGNLSSNGVVVHLHVHGGVLPGGADTGEPK